MSRAAAMTPPLTTQMMLFMSCYDRKMQNCSSTDGLMAGGTIHGLSTLSIVTLLLVLSLMSLYVSDIRIGYRSTIPDNGEMGAGAAFVGH